MDSEITIATNSSTTDTLSLTFEQFYCDVKPRLVAFLRTMVHSNELAEDLCHETFIKALQAWKQSHKPTNTIAWIYRIARNTAIDELRRQRRIVFIPMDNQLPKTYYDQEQHVHFGDAESIQQALDQVPSLYRQALILYVYYGYCVSEIASVYGCSRGAIKARLFRARAYFRLAYQQEH